MKQLIHQIIAINIKIIIKKITKFQLKKIYSFLKIFIKIKKYNFKRAI